MSANTEPTQAANGSHHYLSTACLHGHHDYCAAPTVDRSGQWQTIGPSYSAMEGEPKKPAECKFCTAPCECHCHAPDRGGGH